MADIHIDDFYRDVAKSLVFLYGHFPRKTMLCVEAIAGPDTPDEFGLHSPRHQACFHCFLWLSSNGYLLYDQPVRQEALDQVVLSHRGFLVLSEPYAGAFQHPEDQPIGPPTEHLFIHQLRDDLKCGTSFTLAETVRSLMLKSRDF